MIPCYHVPYTADIRDYEVDIHVRRAYSVLSKAHHVIDMVESEARVRHTCSRSCAFQVVTCFLLEESEKREK